MKPKKELLWSLRVETPKPLMKEHFLTKGLGSLWVPSKPLCLPLKEPYVEGQGT